ncbi:MAG: HEAT repeat domain-containing protein [Chthonomonadales bacterium]
MLIIKRPGSAAGVSAGRQGQAGGGVGWRAWGKDRRKWLIALLAGFVVTLVVGFLYTRVWHRYSPEILKMARKMGTDPATEENLDRIIGLVDLRRPVAGGDWEALVRYCDDRSPMVRGMALGLMGFMKYTGRSSEMVAIARAHLEDREEFPRSCALIALQRLGDPVWRQKVREWANSPDPLVQHTVHLLLERANRGRAQ